MASSAKITQSSPAPTSRPRPTPPLPEDPLVEQAIQYIEAMDEGQMARSAGQILYDIAIQDPIITIGTMEDLGTILKQAILNNNSKLHSEWLPLLRQYTNHSLVAKDPRLVSLAFTRLVTMHLYISGKLGNANQAHNASA